MMIAQDNAWRRFRAELRRQCRIFRFRCLLGRDRDGRRALEALRRLAPEAVALHSDNFTCTQQGQWGRYLDEWGRINPLSTIRLLRAGLGWLLLVALLFLLGLAGGMFSRPSSTPSERSNASRQEPPAPPSTAERARLLLLDSGDMMKVPEGQPLILQEDRLLVRALAEDGPERAPDPRPAEQFQGEFLKVPPELHLRTFVAESGGNPGYLWPGGDPEGGAWISGPLAAAMKTLSEREPEPPPAVEADGEELALPLPDNGRLALQAGSTVRAAPETSAPVLLQAEGDESLLVAGDATVDGDQLWLSLVVETPEGRYRTGWIEVTVPSWARIEHKLLLTVTSGAKRRLRRQPVTGQPLGTISREGAVELSGGIREVNGLFWLSVRANRAGCKRQDCWMGIDLSTERPEENEDE